MLLNWSRLGLCVVVLVGGAVSRCVGQEAGGVDSSRFELTELITGLRQPMELAVGPAGEVYFIELEGKLKVFDPRLNEVRLIGELAVTTAQENGLIGLALDPDFRRNGHLYLQYSPPDYEGQHVSRFTLRDGRLDLASERLLLKYPEQRKECCHHAGSLQFGPRGELFISTGDNTNPFGDSQGFAPIDERPGRAPFDAQATSGTTHSYNGKVLRIRPTADGGYEIPEGNLFPADGSQGRPEIYVMGCRNPWRISVDPATGYLYWGDVGPDAGGEGPRGPRGHDEINQARAAGNFGWPYFVADNRAYHRVDFATGAVGEKFDASAPVNESPNNTGRRTLPPAQPAFLYYPSSPSPEFPPLGQGGRTACAGPVFHFDPKVSEDRQFPREYDGALFIYEWSRNWIRVVHLDESQNVKRIEPFWPEQPVVRPIDMQFGPEGALYLLEYGDTWGLNANARLVRIDYVRGNRPPVAACRAENNIGRQPLEVTLFSDGSFDKDAGDKLAFEWRLLSTADPEAAPRVLSREPRPKVTIAEPGVYNVELVVTDSHGATRRASLPVIVGNAHPRVRFLEPASGDFFDPGRPISYSLEVDDQEDGTSDFEAVEQQGRDPLDPAAPSRVSLNAVYLPGGPPSASGEAPQTAGPPGMRRMRGSDCFNCHAVDQLRVGPPLLEIARKYRGQEGALEKSIERVLKGSTGVWGKVPMIPHSQHTVAEVHEMVSWIYSLEPAGLVRVFPGFVGEIPVLAEDLARPGYYALEANYTDRGAGAIPALAGSARLHLRPRLLEAEFGDEVNGPTRLNSARASGGAFLGSINHNHFVRWNGVNLDRVARLRLSVASAGAGGKIEVRLDSPTGPLLGETAVEVTGDWEKFYDRFLDVPANSGRHDLFVRFVNPANPSALMNLDCVEFLASAKESKSDAKPGDQKR